MTYSDFKSMLYGSIEYEFNGTVLTIRGYFDGNGVSLDLSQMSEEAFDDMVIEDYDE